MSKTKQNIDKLKRKWNNKIDNVLNESTYFPQETIDEKRDYLLMKKLLLIEGLLTDVLTILIPNDKTKVTKDEMRVFTNELINLNNSVNKNIRKSSNINKKISNGKTVEKTISSPTGYTDWDDEY